MKVDRRGLFKAIVGTGAAFGLALGGCAADNSDAKDAAASSGGSSGSGGGSGSGGSGSGGSKAGSGGAGAQDAKVVTDTFKGWATGVPCRA
jgi:hypothetical protein